MCDDRTSVPTPYPLDRPSSASVSNGESTEGILRRVAKALELPAGASIAEYAAHVKQLCAARGDEIHELNRLLRGEPLIPRTTESIPEDVVRKVTVADVLRRCHADAPSQEKAQDVRRMKPPPVVYRLRAWADWLDQEGSVDQTLPDLLREAIDAMHEQLMAKSTRVSRS